MQDPDRVLIHSIYQGVEYGQPIAGRKISVKLVVNRQVVGEISVGYIDDAVELLPEEQRMLSEIARTLTLALERKELSERLVLKQEEEAQYRENLAKLELEIEARSRELEEQHKKLSAVDSYLATATRSWEASRRGWKRSSPPSRPDGDHRPPAQRDHDQQEGCDRGSEVPQGLLPQRPPV